MDIDPNKLDFHTRFAFDNIRDGIGDGTLIMWPAYDNVEHREVWIVGRRVKDKVMPIAALLNSVDAVKRYAPAIHGGPENRDYDFSQVTGGRIIRP